jgi:hypothetical protein
MPQYNAIITDEQSGDYILVWAVNSERLRFTNEITSEPIDTRGSTPSKEIADNIHFNPLEIDITVDLTGDPGVAFGSLGGAGYELIQHQKLCEFVNRKTTFSYQSFLFANQTANGMNIQPGIPTYFLAMAEYEAVKGTTTRGGATNIIGARIKFQSVVYTDESGNAYTSPDDAYSYGEQEMSEYLAGQAWTAIGAGLVGGAVGMILGGPIGMLIGMGIAIVGALSIATGSVPRQSYSVRINGLLYDVELRTNEAGQFCTFSFGRRGVWFVRERPIEYGEDLLAGVVDPACAGLHIGAIGMVEDVTPETLGRTVGLIVLSEAAVG